ALAFTLAPVVASGQLFPPPQPPENPINPSKVRLGKALFWDEQISSTRTVSCGTCHIPAGGGSDPRSLVSPLAVHPGPDGLFGGDDEILGSPGVPLAGADGLYLSRSHFGLTDQPTSRRAMPSVIAGYSPRLFWDGRAEGEFRDPITKEVLIATGGALESQA